MPAASFSVKSKKQLSPICLEECAALLCEKHMVLATYSLKSTTWEEGGSCDGKLLGVYVIYEKQKARLQKL